MTTTTANENTPLLNETQRQQGVIRKKRSLLPMILLIQLLFTMHWIANGYYNSNILNTRQALALCSVPIFQAVWGIVIMHLGQSRQLFAQQTMLDTMPMIWLPLFPVILQTVVFNQHWNVVNQLLDSTIPSIIALEGIRVLAIGSLFKWGVGLFPTAFALGTALFDMLFGLSAWILLAFDLLNFQTLFYWNALGLILILPVGILIVQAGMKPTELYKSTVSYKVVFEYPMVLGPAAVVPIMLAWNGLMMRYAYERLFNY